MRLTMLAAAALVACGTPTPRPIALNEDACAYCRMTISDPRFGGEIVTRTGRVETFDSIECLASWVSATDASSIASIYVMDFDRPGRLVNATAAGFLRNFPVRGPMGHALAAFADPAAAERARARLGRGISITWRDILNDKSDASERGR